jgi:drug/metabolite transporter (DMT)-like permease
VTVFYLPILLTMLATSIYHVAQKSVSLTVSPLVSLTVTYLTALSITLIALALSPGAGAAVRSARELNWATFAVGISIVVVELAFLLAYRVGWRLSLASAVANVATAVLLLIVGLVIYREHLSPRQIGGVALCLLGLVLAVRR